MHDLVHKLSFGLCVFLLSAGCQQRVPGDKSPVPAEPVTETREPSIVMLSHGTSFGMCAGYCYKEKRFSESTIIHFKKSWFRSDPEVHDTLSTTNPAWREMVGLIDLDSVKDLPDRIGCPDCADGGAEWIAVRLSDSSGYKVTFEYREEVKGMGRLLQYLRQL